MIILKVAYMPDFTKEFIALIHEYCSSSMQSTDYDTEQFEINHVKDTIQEKELSLNSEDEKILKELSDAKIDYFEIKIWGII